MKLPISKFTILLIAISLFLPLTTHGQEEFKLKEGASGKICLGCHDRLQEIMEKPFVHTPLTDGNCIGCHNPHTSEFSRFISAPADRICYTCHDNVISAEAESVHQVVAEGKCISCHDPHAADYEANLLREGSKLCFECHQELETKIKTSKFSHSPVKENCVACHNPHASEDNSMLLEDKAPDLCLGCHATDSSTFKSLHRDYPVQKADCTSCHDPHGSNQAALLYDVVHPPVAKRNCERCHVPASSTPPFALKAGGHDTCRACHYELISDMLNESLIHWPVVDAKGCMNCHNPHASPQEKLMREPMLEICGKCHSDTLERQKRSATEHPPIAEGRCGECHAAHSSDNKFILKKDSLIDICADCHEWQTHTTHPIGEEYVDPRNPNLTLQCSSCHRTHGTEHNHFLYFAQTNELCVQCHVRYRR